MVVPSEHIVGKANPSILKLEPRVGKIDGRDTHDLELAMFTGRRD
jgi:hypothetical protein